MARRRPVPTLGISLDRVVRSTSSIAIALLGLGAGCCAGAQTLSVELMTGSAYNFPTPLAVHQSGYPEIQMTAHYDTSPFGHYFPYYALRISRWDGDAASEFEQLHHRLLLADVSSEIQFSPSITATTTCCLAVAGSTTVSYFMWAPGRS
jgi:hypothetical protein